MTWLVPGPGARVRQTRAYGPFVVQRRDIVDFGGVLLTRHPGAVDTTFTVVGYEERSEIGLPCHVILLEDDRDQALYVVDTALMGPGLPADAFEIVEDAPGGGIP